MTRQIVVLRSIAQAVPGVGGQWNLTLDCGHATVTDGSSQLNQNFRCPNCEAIVATAPGLPA